MRRRRECLGNAITAGLIALAIPVLVSVALLVLRFPGDHLLQLLFVPLAWVNRDLLLRLADWASGFSVWESPVPWWAWLGTLPSCWSSVGWPCAGRPRRCGCGSWRRPSRPR
ncbi:MAG: hypothetical protein HZY73_03890 [Micropruina sp.]|nr:MAG: hypothetical protein HZY73_03890 [Micropruina sp.]